MRDMKLSGKPTSEKITTKSKKTKTGKPSRKRTKSTSRSETYKGPRLSDITHITMEEIIKGTTQYEYIDERFLKTEDRLRLEGKSPSKRRTRTPIEEDESKIYRVSQKIDLVPYGTKYGTKTREDIEDVREVGEVTSRRPTSVKGRTKTKKTLESSKKKTKSERGTEYEFSDIEGTRTYAEEMGDVGEAVERRSRKPTSLKDRTETGVKKRTTEVESDVPLKSSSVSRSRKTKEKTKARTPTKKREPTTKRRSKETEKSTRKLKPSYKSKEKTERESPYKMERSEVEIESVGTISAGMPSKSAESILLDRTRKMEELGLSPTEYDRLVSEKLGEIEAREGIERKRTTTKLKKRTPTKAKVSSRKLKDISEKEEKEISSKKSADKKLEEPKDYLYCLKTKHGYILA